MRPDVSMTVADLMTRYPSSMEVFVARRMLCIGCPAQSYHTLGDAAVFHGLDPETLVQEIDRAIRPKDTREPEAPGTAIRTSGKRDEDASKREKGFI